jgi:hypothetical protein
MADLDLGIARPFVVFLLAERHTGRRQNGGRRNATQETTPVGIHASSVYSLSGTSVGKTLRPAREKAAGVPGGLLFLQQ